MEELTSGLLIEVKPAWGRGEDSEKREEEGESGRVSHMFEVKVLLKVVKQAEEEWEGSEEEGEGTAVEESESGTGDSGEREEESEGRGASRMFEVKVLLKVVKQAEERWEGSEEEGGGTEEEGSGSGTEVIMSASRISRERGRRHPCEGRAMPYMRDITAASKA